MRTVETLAAIVVLFAFPPAADAQARPVTGVVRIGGEPTSEVVVYLEGEETAGASEADRNAGPPVIDQNHLRFLPGVVAVRAGTEVDFLNSDGILHNVFSPGWSGEDFDLGTYPSGSARTHLFTEPGPHVILCKVHPEMVAYVVVVETPYFAVSDAAGAFLIRGVPSGRYTLTAWRRGHEEMQAEVVVSADGVEAWALDLSTPGLVVSSDIR